MGAAREEAGEQAGGGGERRAGRSGEAGGPGVGRDGRGGGGGHGDADGVARGPAVETAGVVWRARRVRASGGATVSDAADESARGPEQADAQGPLGGGGGTCRTCCRSCFASSPWGGPPGRR